MAKRPGKRSKKTVGVGKGMTRRWPGKQVDDSPVAPLPEEEVVGGIDVHSSLFVAAVLVPGRSGVEYVTCKSATSKDLNAFIDRLVSLSVRRVAVEATGVFWMRLHELLIERGIGFVLANPAQVKAVAGRKADKRDAARLAHALRNGSLRESFVASSEQRELRDLTRGRVGFVRTVVAHKNRIHKVLRANGIPLADAVRDIFCVTTRPCLEALAKGQVPDTSEQSLKHLSTEARRKVREALDPRFGLSASARLVLSMELESITTAEQHIAAIDRAIAAWLKSHCKWGTAVELADSIPGISTVSAAGIIGEIGNDPTRFPSAEALVSWAGLCPGQNESAGKQKGSRAPKGNAYVRRLVIEGAQTFGRNIPPERNGHAFHEKIVALKARMPWRKAVTALARRMVGLVWTMLSTSSFYSEAQYQQDHSRQKERMLERQVRSLTRAGYGVTPPPSPLGAIPG